MTSASLSSAGVVEESGGGAAASSSSPAVFVPRVSSLSVELLLSLAVSISTDGVVGVKVGRIVWVGVTTLLMVPMECITVMSNTEGSVGSVIISGSSAVFMLTLEMLALMDESRNTGSHPETGPDGTLPEGSRSVSAFVGRTSWLPSCSCFVLSASPCLVGAKSSTGCEDTGASCISTMVDLLGGSSSVAVTSGPLSRTVSLCIVVPSPA